MKQTFNLVCRGSWLSLAQAAIFKNKVAAIFPEVVINVIGRDTAGDKNQSTPLHLVEGKDFFTKDIHTALEKGEADFALHSMKDVSSEQFFANSNYAIIDRDDIRDVAIFNNTVTDKIKSGKKIIIGTSSPRRSQMATGFLQKALPAYNNTIPIVEAIPIRGNVDVRLKKLTAGGYDGIILAVAGLNRLLQYNPSKLTVQQLLANKKLMFLPLFECPPATGQGAIVAETISSNTQAIQILDAIKNVALTAAIQKERTIAEKYGYGCSQTFGAFHLATKYIAFTYASGKNNSGENFTDWKFNIDLNSEGKNIFSSTDFMKDFFSYTYLNDVILDNNSSIIFVASHKAIHSTTIKIKLETKQVWAPGTRTWFELAKMGLWVQGCADGLGLDFILPAIEGPLINSTKSDVEIVTNTSSANNWLADNWKAKGTYTLIPTLNKTVTENISTADIIFWTSFQQYQHYKKFINQNVQHVCLPGKTTELFLAAGITPVLFPSIKAFNQWKTANTLQTAGG